MGVGGLKTRLGGGLSKNNAKWGGGAQIKITLITGGPNFHFMSSTFAINCKNASTCFVKQEMYSQLCPISEVYIKKVSSHFRHVPDFPSKIIDLCHKISVILVSITRPNSTKNITCP